MRLSSLICILGLCIVQTGCQTRSPSQPMLNENSSASAKALTPREAIFAAADAAPNGAKGEYSMFVKATGEQNGYVYLNSEADYRDQRNLSIRIPPSLRAALTKVSGVDPKLYYMNKAILVKGEAMRTYISLNHLGTPTGKYYYQTQIEIASIDQIVVEPAKATTK